MIFGVKLTNLNNIKYDNAKKLLDFLLNYYYTKSKIAQYLKIGKIQFIQYNTNFIKIFHIY